MKKRRVLHVRGAAERRWKALSARTSKRSASKRTSPTAISSCSAPSVCQLEDRILLLQTAARIILLSRQGSLAQQMERVEGSPENGGTLPAPAPPQSATARVSKTHRRRIAAPAILQRPGRIFRGRPRVRHRARPEPMDTGPVDQRHFQRRIWLSSVGIRRGLHVVRQQPRKPTHSLVQ